MSSFLFKKIGMHHCRHKFAYFLITKFEGNINMILETNWELENVTFSGIWITSHWNRVYRTNKSWKSFTQIEFHFISIRFNSESWKSEVIFSYPKKMAPLCVFCPKLSLENSSSDVSPGGRQSKSFSKLHFWLDLIQNVGNQKSSLVTPRWCRCECFAQSLVDVSSWWATIKTLLKASLPTLTLSLSLLTKSFIFKIGGWWGVKPFSGGDQLKLENAPGIHSVGFMS